MNLPLSLSTTIICLIMTWGNVFAAEAALESPACIDQFKQPSEDIQQLSTLLANKQFKSFYKAMGKYAFTFKVTTQDNVDTELLNKIWHCYLVASGPLLFFKTCQTIEPDVHIDSTADLDQKFKVCILMEKYIRLVNLSTKIKEPVKKQIITRLLIPYYVRILQQFHNAHEHSPMGFKPQTEPYTPKKEKIIYITSQEQVDAIRKLINDVAGGESFINGRNEVSKHNIALLENFFMEILVSTFPGKYSTVTGFLLEAGFAEKDIPALIDRTVGRNKSTDFLYKGRHRLQHDRMLKNKK